MTTRRKFIVATGAALATLPLSAKLLSDSVPSDEVPIGTFTGHDCMLKPRDPHILIVVPTMVEAVKIQQRMGNPRNVKIISMGSAICGYGADLIIMDDDCKSHAETKRFPYQDWYNSAVRTRLMPGGSHIQSSFRTEVFDWGNSHGLSMQFVDMDREEITRNAVALRNKRTVSFDDRIEAKATLYKWWIRQRGIDV